MRNVTTIRAVFALSALYDGILGAVFLGAGPRVFDFVRITPPNHWGYVHFAACVLLIFALMFARIAATPRAARALIPYGVLLKLAYCSVVFGHLVFGPDGIPLLWVWFAITDAAFLIAFVWGWWALGRPDAEQPMRSDHETTE